MISFNPIISKLSQAKGRIDSGEIEPALIKNSITLIKSAKLLEKNEVRAGMMGEVVTKLESCSKLLTKRDSKSKGLLYRLLGDSVTRCRAIEDFRAD